MLFFFRSLETSQDKSFTLTLFAHDSTFSSIDAQLASSDSNGSNPVVELFRKEFPDALEHMGEEALLRSWKENPKDGLITVEVCSVALCAAMMHRYSEARRFADQV